jgi:DNA-binding beta-propeller fold protein YncE
MTLLSACATVLTVTPIGRESDGDEGPGRACTEDRPLSPWGEVSGPLTATAVVGSGTGAGVFQLGLPVDVAAMMNDLYLLDVGLGQILIFDRGGQVVRRRVPVPNMGPRGSLHVDRSLSLYVANPSLGEVLQLDLDGRFLQRFSSPAVMSDPVSVSVTDGDGRLYVGDGLSARVVIFNAQGAVERVLGAEPGSDFQPGSVVDVATAPDQLYVSDEVGRQIHFLSGTGRYRYAFGQDSLIAPGAVVLDEDNRVYVADNGDGTIKIYRGGELLSVFGGASNASGIRFGRISGMWYGEGLLYVADPETVSIRIFQVSPPCPPLNGAGA